MVRADMFGILREMFDADRAARFRGEAAAMVPIVAPEGEPCALPAVDADEWFRLLDVERAPSWVNQCTLRSAEMAMEYEPGVYVGRVSPTPLLMIVEAGDTLAGSDIALDAYERARAPKRLELLPGGHFDVYVAHFDRSSAAARDWFVQHLMAPAQQPVPA